MIHHPLKRFQPDRPFPDLLMPVLMTRKRILTVIHVNRLQPLKPDHPVKLLQHLIQLSHQIIPRVIHMTRIQANTHMVLQLHPIQNLRQFLKVPTNLCSLSCHRLQKHRRVLLLLQNLIQHLTDHPDSFLCTLSYVTSRMKIITVPRNMLHPFQIILHRHPGKFPGLCILRTWIQCIWRMSQDLTDIMLLRIFQKLSHILRIYFFRSASSWISGEKLKGIRSNLHRLFSHMKKSLRRGQMTTYSKHSLSFSFRSLRSPTCRMLSSSVSTVSASLRPEISISQDSSSQVVQDNSRISSCRFSVCIFFSSASVAR